MLAGSSHAQSLGPTEAQRDMLAHLPLQSLSFPTLFVSPTELSTGNAQEQQLNERDEGPTTARVTSSLTH